MTQITAPFAHCLTTIYSKAAAKLQTNIEAAFDAGGLPFEIIAGVPANRYGARVTFYPATHAPTLARAFDLERHPWGVPSWIGIRVLPNGEAKVKPYHRAAQFGDRFALPPQLPSDLYPLAASFDRGTTKELYLRQRAPMAWDCFVNAALAPFGHGDYPFKPYPRGIMDGFGLSLRWTDERVTAISLYAFSRALPDDLAIRKQWIEGMEAADLEAYEMALLAARSLGRLTRGKRHSILAWTLERGGEWHRAVSLRVVPTQEQVRYAAAREPICNHGPAELSEQLQPDSRHD